MLRPLLLFLQLTASAAPSEQPIDSVHLRARVENAMSAFLAVHQSAWKFAQAVHPALAPGELVREGDERLTALHCHWDLNSIWLRRHIITGTTAAHANCPRFLAPDVKLEGDERLSIDDGLLAVSRPNVQERRFALRLLLDSAAQSLPTDTLIAGQRIRFALDAGDIDGAARAALTCGFAPVQCGLWQGLVLYRLGDVARADSTFAAAADMMTSEQRCAWNDVRVLLDPEVKKKYERMSCAERAEFERQLWWLSDPLWAEAGNERRVEHVARKVMIDLLAALQHDGRQYFSPKKGGESVIEGLVRYGWPSQMYWAGKTVDNGHDRWLDGHHAESASPYVVREYTRERRFHTLPLPLTLADPFVATRDGWQLAPRAGEDDWWPREHYARDASAIDTMPVGQTVMLRRRDSTRVIWAGLLDSAQRRAGSNRRTTLFDSRAVNVVGSVSSLPVRGDTMALADALVGEGRSLFGIEILGDSSVPALRSRYGVQVIAPLSALGGARAISDALLFDPPKDATQSLPTATAIARMYGTTTLRRTDRVGVYWETYGFQPSDTVELSVKITRVDRPNFVVRTLRVLGIGESGGNNVAVRWREVPGSSRAIQQVEGTIPVQLRSIVIDVSRLPRGDYVMQLATSRPGETAVTSDRHFSLR